MRTEDLLDYGLFTGLIMCLTMCTGQLLLKRKELKNYYVIAFTLLVAVYQFSILYPIFDQFDSWYTLFPYVYIAGMFSIYCTIPLVALFFIALTRNNDSFSLKNLLHLLIPLGAGLVLILFADFPANPGGSRREYIGFLYDTVPVIRLVDQFSMVLVFIYYSYLAGYYLLLYRKSEGKAERKRNLSVVIGFSCIALSMTVLYIAYQRGTGILHHIFELRFTLLSGYLLLFSFRYPYIVNIIKLEAYREHYLKSKIDDVRVDEILDSLDHLMNSEKLFLDNSLSIKKTAEKLGIAAQKLSEILNTQLHTNFGTYLRQKRIEYAQDMLICNPEDSILSISLDCGYNTISNFNTSFKKISGMSPREYRKKYCK